MAKVLIVNPDESIVTHMGKLIPDSQSNTVEYCNCVSDALDYLANESTDIIITDIFPPKPECTGIIDYCAVNHPNTKIILTSKRKSFSYARMAVRCANVVDFITNPIDTDYVTELIDNLSRTADALKSLQGERVGSRENEIFSNIVHGYTTNPSEITRCFDELNLCISLTNQPCTLIHFHMDDFADKTKSEQFYDALSSSIPFETEEVYCALTNYSYGNFSWFIIHKHQDDLPRRVVNILDFFKNTFRIVLNLSTEVSSCKTWFSISDMLSGIESTRLGGDDTADNTITNAMYFIRQNYQKDISLASVAEYVNMNPIYFSTYFKKHTGEKFMDVLTTIRIEQAAKLLVTTRMTIKDIKLSVGYGHTGNFYKHFHDKYNMTPNEYKKEFLLSAQKNKS